MNRKQSRHQSSAVYELTCAYEKANKKRNRILIGTVAIAVIMLFSISSIVKGKLSADILKIIRTEGTIATAYLDEATEQQYQQVQQLNDINCAGRERFFGSWYRGDRAVAKCIVLDQIGFDKLMKPAYTDVIGTYPEESNEVMLPLRLLEKLESKEPAIGMSIVIKVTRDDWMTSGADDKKETFILSGYYTDYVDEAENVPNIYFSKKYLKENGIEEYPARILMETKQSWLNAKQIEDRLYQDISTEVEQQIVGKDSPAYQSMKSFVGGFGMAVICSFIILISVYLLIYNVTSISMNRDVRQYGLLKTLGITNKQIKEIFFLQSFKTIAAGCMIGSLGGSLMMYVGLPRLLAKLYLAGVGTIENMETFTPEFLIGANILTCILTLSATSKSIRKMVTLSPIETLRYEESRSKSRKKQVHTKNGAEISKMAWRNVTSSRRKFIVTLLSLVLGCEVALCSIVIAKGTDTTNQIAENPDFEIGIGREVSRNYPYDDTYEYNIHERTLFPQELIDKILEEKGIVKNSVKYVKGGYAFFDYKEESIQPRMDSTRGTIYCNSNAMVHIVEEAYMDELETYVEKQNLSTDMESLKNGSGFILLHKHELSEGLQNKAEQVIGMPLHFDKIENDTFSGRETELICCGYLDTTIKHFPKLDMDWNGDGINYFIVSEKAYEKLELTPQTFKLIFDVEPEQEAEVKKELTKLIQDANEEAGELKNTYLVVNEVTDGTKAFYLTANSDIMEAAQSYIVASHMIMMTISAVLILMGIINYINTVATSIDSRRREFAIMKSIGMTERQLRKMLIYEGLYYVLEILGVLLTVGTLLIILVGKYIQNNLEYFKFFYPIGGIAIITATLLVACIMIPQIEFRKIEKTSAIETLRNHLE